MRLAVMIFAHCEPETFGKLAQSLRGDAAKLFLHVNSKIDSLKFIEAIPPDLKFAEAEKRFELEWGSPAFLVAIINLIKQAYQDPEGPFDYFLLCSGQDCAIGKPGEILAKLEAEPYEYIRSRPARGRKLDRVRQRFIPGPKAGFRLTMVRRLLRLFPKRNIEVFLRGKTLAAGRPWWCLSAKAIEHVLSELESNPEVLAPFVDGFAAEEYFFATIIYNSVFREKVKETLTFVAPNRQPTLMMEPEDVQVGREKGYLIARKFSLVQKPEVYETLDL